MNGKIIKVIYVALGIIFMSIGVVGVILPILPTTPFLLLATFFFARGSEKFHKWFISTSLYKKHLSYFVKSKAMTLRTKFSILVPASSMLIIAFILVPRWHAKILIVAVFIFKYYYFFFRIQTIKDCKQVNKLTLIDERREKEKKLVTLIIRIYCRGKKHGSTYLCKECEELLNYSIQRIDRCPFMETKTFCSNCSVHCYDSIMKARIKEVMRYSGPRMLMHHPFIAIEHAAKMKKQKGKT